MNNTKKLLLIFVNVFFITIFLTGCWDSKDINEKVIGTTVIIDKKDGEVIIYLEIANIQASTSSEGKTSSSGGQKYTFIEGHGKTIVEARENLDHQLTNPLYLSAIKALILTENFAKEDLVEYLYRLRNDETYRKKTITAVTNDDPKEMLKLINENELSVGIEADLLLSTLEEVGKSFSRTTLRLLENLSSTYTGFLMPMIGLQENNMVLKGYCVVNGTKCEGSIPVEEAHPIVFLKGDKAIFRYIIPYKEVNYTIETSLKKRDIKAKYENNKISFDVKFDIEAMIMYGDKKLPYNLADEDMKKISESLKDILKKELEASIDQSQKEFKCDYFQFDDEFRIHYPNDFEKMNWEDEYPKAEIKIDVKVDMAFTEMMDYGTYKLK